MLVGWRGIGPEDPGWPFAAGENRSLFARGTGRGQNQHLAPQSPVA